MKIHDRHFNHGAALIQIAEHTKFTAINLYELENGDSTSAYRINDKIVTYFKYATKPIGSYNEYVFTFTKEHLKQLDEIFEKVGRKIYIVLVCVKDREICCVSYPRFTQLIKVRQDDAGKEENQYNILVSARFGKSFRLGIGEHATKNTLLKNFIIPRNDFPSIIFS